MVNTGDDVRVLQSAVLAKLAVFQAFVLFSVLFRVQQDKFFFSQTLKDRKPFL